MNKFVLYVACAVLAVSVTSCDFFRSLAGRPTSADLREVASKPVEPPAPQVIRDTVVIKEYVKVPEYVMEKREGRLSVPFAYTHTNSKFKVAPEYGYYILVGTYRKKATLNEMISSARAAGYEPYLLEYESGLTSVGLLPCNELGQAVDSYATVRKEQFCPKDACVLIVK